MEKWKKRAVELVCGLATSDNQDASVVAYRPQKTEISQKRHGTMRRATPESVGISSLRLVNMLTELESERRARIHGILVIKGGRVICEASAPGYSMDEWFLSHSMSKTVMGMAVGLLVDDGLLDVGERLVDIFPEEKYTDPRFADITVAHLLSMSSGVEFSEIGVVTESEWTRAFFTSPLNFAPGERFAYNSMNSYILARIVTKKIGGSLVELVSRRIFLPLGIRQYFWEMGPEGVEKGGFGLYLSAESWARLGMMMLGRGSYMGRRILSEKWVSDSLVTRSISPESMGEFNYGYHVWVHRRCDEFLFNGMLGQNVWVCPAAGIVAVIYAGNNEIFQQSPALYIVRKYLAGRIFDRLRLGDFSVLKATCRRFFESRAAAHPLAKGRSLSAFFGFKNATPYNKAWNPVLGEYSMRKNNLSLLPVFVRCIQNNLRSGVESLELLREGDRLFMNLHGPVGEQRVEIGLYDYADTVIGFNGEIYRLRVLGEVVRGADGNDIYRIELIFPEIPNSRVIEFSVLDRDRVEMSLYEMPNERIVTSLLSSVALSAPKISFAVQMLERRYGRGFFEDRLKKVFCPKIILVRRGCSDEEELILSDSERADSDNAVVRSLAGLISHFMREGPTTEQTGEERLPEEGRGVLLGLLDRIRRFIRGE